MKFLKYTIDITEFQPRPWTRVELEYEGEKEEKGTAYVYQGWLWFVSSYTEKFGWDDFQQTIENSVTNTESDYDGMGNFSRFGNPPKNN